MNKNTIISITSPNKGNRLDKFLADLDASLSRAAWQKKIRAGRVLVNGKISAADHALKEGDIISILPEEKISSKGEVKIPDIRIVYEDENIIVIDKPVGVIAQRAESSAAPAVTDFLENHFPPIKKIGEDEQKSGLVHRLDKDTSGIMIAAKNQPAFEFLKDRFKKREVEKTYTALVYGKVQPPEGEIALPIGRNPKAPCRQTTIRHPENTSIKCRPARTLYRTQKSSDRFSLLEVELKTGRMHQIRVHMKAIGHPIAGDQKYAPKSLLAKTPQLKRQFLHASARTSPLPDGQKKASFSPHPADLADFLKNLTDLD